MSTVLQFHRLLESKASEVRYVRDSSVTACPCRTKQGYRDPVWHLNHPTDPVCNAAGMLPDVSTTLDLITRAFVHPVQSGAVRRLTAEQLQQLFGEIETDDHLGIFPCQWRSVTLNFYEWPPSTKDFIEYNERHFTVVSANLIPDPSDGNPFHHWECGLRLISNG
jgi:hypothetical protein